MHAHTSAFVSFAEAPQAQEAVRLLQGTHFDPGAAAARGGGARIRASLAVRTSLPPRDKEAVGFREIPLSERRLGGCEGLCWCCVMRARATLPDFGCSWCTHTAIVVTRVDVGRVCVMMAVSSRLVSRWDVPRSGARDCAQSAVADVAMGGCHVARPAGSRRTRTSTDNGSKGALDSILHMLGHGGGQDKDERVLGTGGKGGGGQGHGADLLEQLKVLHQSLVSADASGDASQATHACVTHKPATDASLPHEAPGRAMSAEQPLPSNTLFLQGLPADTTQAHVYALFSGFGGLKEVAFVSPSVCARTHARAHTHTHVHTHMHMHTHTYMHARVCR